MPRLLRNAAIGFAIAVSATCGDKNPLSVESNHPPVVAAVQLTVDEDSGGVADVLAAARDADGDSLVLAGWGQGSHGAVAREGAGLRYTPVANYNGPDAFPFTVGDGQGGEAQDTVHVTVRPVNDAPVAADDSARGSEDSPLDVDVLANDTDVDGDSLFIASAMDGGHGASLIDAGRLRYVPEANFSGTDTLRYVVEDGDGARDSARVVVTIVPVNDAPVATDDSVSVNEDDSVTVDVLANDSDADGDSLAVASVADPAHGQAAVEGGAVRYTPAANYNGADSFSYVVSDGNGGADTAAVTVTVVAANDAPVALADSATVAEDGTALIDVLANDVDADGDSLVISAFTQPAHGAVTAEAAGLRYSPSSDYNGTDAFAYTVDDGHGGTATDSVRVTVTAVNDAPVAADDSASTLEGTSVLIDVLANDGDVDGDTLVLSGYTVPAHGSVSQQGNALRYTPDPYFNGADSLRYVVSDGAAADTGIVRIGVSSVNDPPVAGDDSATVAEDGTVLITVLANDTDPDDPVLNVADVTQPAHGAVTLEGDQFRYTPAPDYNGLDSFTYQVSDSALADTATVFLTVSAVNDAPTAGSFAITTAEDLPAHVSPLDHAQDVDGDALVLSAFSQPAHGTTSADSTGVLYTPAANYNGTDGFTYEVSDGHGGTASGSVSVTVQAANDAPVAVADNASVDEDGTVLIDVLLNDSDVDGDVLAVTGFTQGSHGSSTQEGDALRYTPAADYNGTDSFSYDISDGNGGVNTATVTVTVNAVNDPPVAQPDSAALDEDGSVLVDVLANDSDPDGDAVALSGFSQGGNGAVTQDGAALRYTPDANYNGSDSFSYVIADGQGGADTASVFLTVRAVVDSVVAVNDSATVSEDGSIVIDVLNNEINVDHYALVIVGFGQGAHGSVSQVGSSLRYTPAANYNGPDSFTYTMSGGYGGLGTATVFVNVVPANDAPVAAADNASVDEDGTVLIDVLLNDSDIDGDALAITGFTQGSHGSVTQEGDALRYAPAADYNGTDSFTYDISDGKGGLNTATVTITVNAVNDPPAVQPDSLTLDEDGTVLVNVLANDSDPDGDSLTLSGFTQGAHGTVAQEGDSLRYTPDANYNGTDAFTYDASDGNGATVTGNVYVTVNPVGDPPVTVADTVVIDEDHSATIWPLTNDWDPDGDVLHVNGNTMASHGYAGRYGDYFIYNPNSNFYGTDGFSYHAVDPAGNGAWGTVTIIVNPVEDPPTAVDDSATVNEDATVDVPMLWNDTDPDGAMDTLTMTGYTQGSHGAVFPVNKDLFYKPDANFNGSDSFTYSISDGHGGTSSATVYVTVTPVNDAPTANGDSATVSADSTVLIDVLANDVDVDGDSLTATAAWGAAHGAVTLEGNSVRFTPADGYTGTDQFSYTVTDGTVSVDGSVTVTIVAGALASITVTPNPANMGVNSTQQFTASGWDAHGNAVAISPAWSVVNGGGSISVAGLFSSYTMTGTFTNTVRATSGGVSGLATVVVSP